MTTYCLGHQTIKCTCCFGAGPHTRQTLGHTLARSGVFHSGIATTWPKQEQCITLSFGGPPAVSVCNMNVGHLVQQMRGHEVPTAKRYPNPSMANCPSDPSLGPRSACHPCMPSQSCNPACPTPSPRVHFHRPESPVDLAFAIWKSVVLKIRVAPSQGLLCQRASVGRLAANLTRVSLVMSRSQG
jgi:hypothetical protein